MNGSGIIDFRCRWQSGRRARFAAPSGRREQIKIRFLARLSNCRFKKTVDLIVIRATRQGITKKYLK